MGVRWGGSGAIVSRSAWGVNANGGSVAIALLAGGVAGFAGVGSGAVGARCIDQLIAEAGQHLLALARCSRDRRMADGQRGHCSCAHPPEMKRKVHMIPPLNSDKSPQKLMTRSTWTLFSNWMVALS